MKKSTSPSTVNGLLCIKGTDAGKFLQGQLSCDIEELDLNKALPGAYCTPQGRVRANFILLKQSADTYMMLLPQFQAAFLLAALSPYVAFFQCTLEDQSNQWYFCGLSDNIDSNELLSKKCSELLHDLWEISISDEVLYIRLPGTTSRWLCLSQKPLDNTADGYMATDDTYWQQQDMLQGLVWIDEKNRDKFLPHDLSLPDLGAVSFTKGCYVGQEIVARMQYRGKPKYCLAILKTESMQGKPEDKLIQLIDNKEQLEIGKTVDSLHLDNNRWLICASLKRELLKQQEIQLLLDKRSIICRILVLIPK